MSKKIQTVAEYEADDNEPEEVQPEGTGSLADETPDMLDATGALTEDGEAGTPRPPAPDEEEALCASWKSYRDRVDATQKTRAFWTEALDDGTPLRALLAGMESEVNSYTLALRPLGQKTDEIRDKQALIAALLDVTDRYDAAAGNAETALRAATDELNKFESRNNALVVKFADSLHDGCWDENTPLTDDDRAAAGLESAEIEDDPAPPPA